MNMRHLRGSALALAAVVASTGLACAQANPPPKAGGDPVNDQSGAGATGVGGAPTVRTPGTDPARGAASSSGGTSSGTATVGGGATDRPIQSGTGAPSASGGAKPPSSPTGQSNGNTGTGSAPR
jgi:hypothetical protein